MQGLGIKNAAIGGPQAEIAANRPSFPETKVTPLDSPAE
jgi:hypothetical protein